MLGTAVRSLARWQGGNQSDWARTGTTKKYILFEDDCGCWHKAAGRLTPPMTVLPVDVMRVNLANVNQVNKISIGVYATCFAKPSCTHSKVVIAALSSGSVQGHSTRPPACDFLSCAVPASRRSRQARSTLASNQSTWTTTQMKQSLCRSTTLSRGPPRVQETFACAGSAAVPWAGRCAPPLLRLCAAPTL